MRCRILPADAAVPAEVHQRLITELAAAGLELAAEGPGPLLVVDADALVGREEFRMMMYAPGGDRVLVARDHGHGIDIAASSFIDPVGEPNARLAGVAVLNSVVASPVSVAAAIAALDGVAAVDARGFDPPRFDPTRPLGEQLDGLPSARSAARTRRRAAVKNDDNAWTTLAVSPWSQLVAAAAARVGLSPNTVTVASMLVAIVAACLFSVGNTVAVVAAAIAVQVAFGLDCADGQLARLTGCYTPLGAWLDWVSDRLKEVVLLVGLAVGADDALLLGAAAIMISVTRAQLNQSFEDHRTKPARPAGGPFGHVPLSRRLKNLITFPYGDRMGMVSIVAVGFGNRAVLWVWCVWNAAAAGCQLVGRLRRPTGTEASTFSDLLADGPIARAVRVTVPHVPSAVLVTLPLAASVVVIAADGSVVLAAVAMAVAIFVAMLRVRSRVWLLPLATTVVEMAAGMALVSATSGGAQQIAMAVVTVSGARRLVAATGARHETPSARSLGWDGHILVGAAIVAVESWAVIALVAVISIEIVATLSSQWVSVSRR